MNYIGLIHEYKGRQQLYLDQKPADLDKLVELAKIQSTEASNAIEGIVTTNQRLVQLIAIPVLIHDFLCIHPFNDGNGRMSRLLTALLLYKSGYLVGNYISLEKKIQATKEDYFAVLSQSSAGWLEGEHDDTPFIKYLLGIILSAYRDFEDRVNLIGTKMSAREMVEKAVHAKTGKFTKRDIMELCPEIGRGSVENSLKAMCEEGLIKKKEKDVQRFIIR